MHIFSPYLTNEAKFGFNRSSSNTYNSSDTGSVFPVAVSSGPGLDSFPRTTTTTPSTSATRIGDRRPDLAARPADLQDHVVNGNAVYELSFGRGKRLLSHGLGNALAVNWQLTTTALVRTGFPVNLLLPSSYTSPYGNSGTLRPNLVVRDNLSSHKAYGVRERIEAAGAQLLYLPPYSPDLNSIEKAWSKLKQRLRAKEHLRQPVLLRSRHLRMIFSAASLPRHARPGRLQQPSTAWLKEQW